MNSGSREAKEHGCRCPVIDNHYGRGFPYGGSMSFYINADCPIHAAPHSERGAPPPDDPAVNDEALYL